MPLRKCNLDHVTDNVARYPTEMLSADWRAVHFIIEMFNSENDPVPSKWID